MKQSIEYAKKHFADHGFAPYSTAYVATNKDLRNTITCFTKDAEAICEKFVWEQEMIQNKQQSWISGNIPLTTNTYVLHRVR